MRLTWLKSPKWNALCYTYLFVNFLFSYPEDVFPLSLVHSVWTKPLIILGSVFPVYFLMEKIVLRIKPFRIKVSKRVDNILQGVSIVQNFILFWLIFTTKPRFGFFWDSALLFLLLFIDQFFFAGVELQESKKEM